MHRLKDAQKVVGTRRLTKAIEQGQISLADVAHSWKSFTANLINKALNRSGTLWMDERFDHIVHPHYHILCTNCGKLSNAPVDYQRKLDLEAADATDYIVSRHYLLFEGICPDCQKWAIDQCLGMELPLSTERS